MSTRLSDIKKNFNLEIVSEDNILISEATQSINLPVVLVLKRQALRMFPDNHVVGLYYSNQLDKFVTIPHSTIGITENNMTSTNKRLKNIDDILSKHENKKIDKKKAIQALKKLNVLNPEELIKESVVIEEKPVIREARQRIIQKKQQTSISKNNKFRNLRKTKIDELRNIINNDQLTEIKFDDGRTIDIDYCTAHSILECYNSLNKSNKQEILAILETKEGFNRVKDFSINR